MKSKDKNQKTSIKTITQSEKNLSAMFRYDKYIDKFSNLKILVIGDIMLDKYILGKVKRVSPEAPVPIVDVSEEKYVPGGAANTAANLAALSSKVFLLGVVGNDFSRNVLQKNLASRGIEPCLVTDESRPTILKVRIMGRGQQLLRIDYEKTDFYNKKTKEELIDKYARLAANADAIIISDYAKGIHEPELINKIIQIAHQNNKIIIADFKSMNYRAYRACDLVAPCEHDAAQMLNTQIKSEDDLVAIGKKLCNDLNSKVLITRGSQGMTIFEDNRTKTIPTKAREVYDTTGAGDTVVAALTLCLASGASLESAAMLATHAAAVVIAKAGTATCTIEELKREISTNS